MNYIFYDTETTGTDRYFDQIVQFAAVLTDKDLNELDQVNIRCRLMPHIVPAPGALKATHITPAMLTDSSLPSHFEAFGAIANKLRDWSPACIVGYNSLSFDEPLLRQAFYQAFQRHCQSKIDYFARRSKSYFTAIDFSRFSGSIRAVRCTLKYSKTLL